MTTYSMKMTCRLKTVTMMADGRMVMASLALSVASCTGEDMIADKKNWMMDICWMKSIQGRNYSISTGHQQGTDSLVCLGSVAMGVGSKTKCTHIYG